MMESLRRVADFCSWDIKPRKLANRIVTYIYGRGSVTACEMRVHFASAISCRAYDALIAVMQNTMRLLETTMVETVTLTGRRKELVGYKLTVEGWIVAETLLAKRTNVS